MTHRSNRLATLAALLAVTALPASAIAQTKPAKATKMAAMPTSGLKAELISDVSDVQKKFDQLATAMTGKYSWRPADKIRSVGEVFMHISGENYALPVAWGVKAPADFAASSLQEAFGSAAALEKTTDETEVKAAIDKSFAHMKEAIASVPDKDLNTKITVFGRKMTKREFLVATVTHMHEHLGQSIAYARMNGVVPPWSANSGG